MIKEQEVDGGFFIICFFKIVYLIGIRYEPLQYFKQKPNRFNANNLCRRVKIYKKR